MKELSDEALKALQQLIAIDTSYPNTEWEALLFLESTAKKEGLFTRLRETAPGRGNLDIYLNKKNAPKLILLSHVDVVPAVKEEWTYPPFSGEIHNDWMWGRGTIDTKQLSIIHLFTLIHFKRTGVDRPIQMLVTSDEERGSKEGLLRYIEEEPDVFQGMPVLNEGGGFPIVINGNVFHLVELGQKGVARIRIRISNYPSANPYMPNHEALFEMTEALRRLDRMKESELLPETVSQMFKIIAEVSQSAFEPSEPGKFIDTQMPKSLKRMMRAMTKTTFSVTQLRAGKQLDVLEGGYEVMIDCRMLPAVTYDVLESHLETVMEGLNGSCEILSFSGGYESKIEETKLEIVEKVLQEDCPSHRIVPYLSIGSSDGRHIAPLGAQVLGYCPVDTDMPFDEVIKLVHGVDERISIHSFELGLKQMTKLLKKLV
ncbi:M20/M25/M40 family metallo-hydrolase [Metaplanococcus flavidus]|uniref:M20/M25/M40 family metallo-hydrolase n=1 Tax=Metaplanococcus flavidus TaxID=569883 RepID=A0ABW3LAQ0_9BACL